MASWQNLETMAPATCALPLVIVNVTVSQWICRSTGIPRRCPDRTAWKDGICMHRHATNRIGPRSAPRNRSETPWSQNRRGRPNKPNADNGTMRGPGPTSKTSAMAVYRDAGRFDGASALLSDVGVSDVPGLVLFSQQT